MDNTIDKALDHIGLYDYIAVLMTGLMSEAVFCTELYLYRGIEICSRAANELISAWEHNWFWIVSTLLGYLLGMMLNSWSGFLHYALKKIRCWYPEKYSKKPAKYSASIKSRIEMLSKHNYILKDSNNIIIWNILAGKSSTIFRGCSITDAELSQVLEATTNSNLETKEQTIEDLYFRCKQKMSPQSKQYALQQQSIAAMSRSLGFFFILLFLLSVMLMIYLLLQKSSIPRRVSMISSLNLLVSITMWLRNERFVRLRYVTILRGGMEREKI